MSLASAAGPHPRARAAARRLVRLRARLSPAGPPPRVFVTSIPKSGTHLVTAVLERLPRMRPAGLHIIPIEFRRDPSAPAMAPMSSRDFDWDHVRRVLERAKSGQFVTAHWPPHPELLDLLDRLDYRSIFAFRDPRDIAVSHAFFAVRRPTHPFHDRYVRRLRTDGDRILASLRGFPADAHSAGFAGVASQMVRFVPWLSSEGTLACRFEDLVGERGGGTTAAQLDAIEALADHVGRPLARGQIEGVAARAWSSKTTTFRRGAIGEWRRYFERRHLEVFEGEGARLLEAYGYGFDDSRLVAHREDREDAQGVSS